MREGMRHTHVVPMGKRDFVGSMDFHYFRSRCFWGRGFAPPIKRTLSILNTERQTRQERQGDHMACSGLLLPEKTILAQIMGLGVLTKTQILLMKLV